MNERDFNRQSIHKIFMGYDYEDSLKYFINTIKNKNMKPFDLEKALNGAAVITRFGSPVTQIKMFDVRQSSFKVYGVFSDNVECWSIDGKYNTIEDSSLDLFMAPVKHQEWRALYKGIHGYTVGLSSCPSEQKVIDSYQEQTDFIKAILVREWEE